MNSDLIHTNFKLNGISFSRDSLISHLKQNKEYLNFLISWFDEKDYIVAKTSGSTGPPKLIRLKKSDMISSAKLTANYFKLTTNSKVINCLPIDYIAGKMMLVRSLVNGWDLSLFPISSEPIKEISLNYDFIALTPMQLEKSLHNINNIKTVIVGGNYVNDELKEKVLKLKANVYETYGMTETITHVAVKCLSRNENKFSALPGVNFIEIEGCLAIEASHLSIDTITTNDVVTMHSSEKFTWIGRKDFIINSGGVKINPEDIEKKLTKFYSNRLVISSMNDKLLGQKVVLVFEKKIPKNHEEFFIHLKQFDKPKEIFLLDKFPITNGKINRLRIHKLIHKSS